MIFKPAMGWLNRFRKRFGIGFKIICGEEKSVPMQKVDEWRAGEIRNILKEYDSCDIFNADETGLFYQLMPNKTLTVKDETCKGGTKSKQRLTVLLCCNASGTEKLKPMIIGKSAKPRCFKNVRSLPCIYRANQRAWMTQALFNDWLMELDKSMHQQGRKILLLIDNCSAHNLNCILDNVRVEFFPPHCTAVLQPLDLGIIQAVKIQYRSQLVQKMLLNLMIGDTKVNVKEACDMVTSAWNNVRRMTIKKCWKKSHIFEIEVQNETEVQLIDNEMLSLWASVNSDADFTDYVETDNSLCTCAELTDSEIIKNVKEHSSSYSELLDESDNEIESDSSETEILSRSVSFTQAIKSLEDVKNYCYSVPEASDDIFEKLQKLENDILKNATKNLLQSKITDYFINL